MRMVVGAVAGGDRLEPPDVIPEVRAVREAGLDQIDQVAIDRCAVGDRVGQPIGDLAVAERLGGRAQEPEHRDPRRRHAQARALDQGAQRGDVVTMSHGATLRVAGLARNRQRPESSIVSAYGLHMSIFWLPPAVRRLSGPVFVQVNCVYPATGEIRDRRAAHDGGVLALAWHPREPLVASTGEDGAVRVHGDGHTRTFATGAAWVERAAWSPDGSALATTAGRWISVWTPGAVCRATALAISTVTGLAWAPSGTRLGVACYGGVHLLDATDLRERTTLAHKGSMLGLAWSPGGKVVACGTQDATVQFWRLSTGKRAEMSGYPLKPTALSWSADGSMLATSGSPAATVWRFDGKGPEGRRPIEIVAHDQPISALAFAPLVRLLATGCRAGRLAISAPGDHPGALTAETVDGRVTAIAWAASHAGARLTAIATGESGTVAAVAL